MHQITSRSAHAQAGAARISCSGLGTYETGGYHRPDSNRLPCAGPPRGPACRRAARTALAADRRGTSLVRARAPTARRRRRAGPGRGRAPDGPQHGQRLLPAARPPEEGRELEAGRGVARGREAHAGAQLVVDVAHALGHLLRRAPGRPAGTRAPHGATRRHACRACRRRA